MLHPVSLPSQEGTDCHLTSEMTRRDNSIGRHAVREPKGSAATSPSTEGDAHLLGTIDHHHHRALRTGNTGTRHNGTSEDPTICTAVSEDATSSREARPFPSHSPKSRQGGHTAAGELPLDLCYSGPGSPARWRLNRRGIHWSTGSETPRLPSHACSPLHQLTGRFRRG